VENASAAAAVAVASFQAAVDPIVIPQRHIYILTLPAAGSLWLEAARSVGDDRGPTHYRIKTPQQAPLTPINSELLNGRSTRTVKAVWKIEQS